MTKVEKIIRPDLIGSSWRSDFPALSGTMNGKPVTFLDNGASAQKPQAVIDALRDVMSTNYANVHRGLYRYSSDLTARFEEVRIKVAQFISAPGPETIVFTRNATEGINLVAQSWGCTNLKSGDEIIITAMEHHANIVPWQLVAEATGAVIKVCPITPDGQLDLAALDILLTSRTKMLAFTHVSNVLGTINDVAAITARVKSYRSDIAVLIDGAQAVVHASVDVAAIGCDFYVLTGHKLYGPTGVGVLYGRYDMLQSMPPYQGGGDMIDRVSFEGTTYRDAPYRFEAGTPAIAEVIGLGEAMDYVSAIGWAAITAHESQLTQECQDMLNNVPGITIYGPTAQRAGIFSFTVPWAHPSDIAMVLDQCGVAVRTGHHCAMPLHDILGVTATVRASLALYNDGQDIAALGAALAKAREMLS